MLLTISNRWGRSSHPNDLLVIFPDTSLHSLSFASRHSMVRVSDTSVPLETLALQSGEGSQRDSSSLSPRLYVVHRRQWEAPGGCTPFQPMWQL